MDVAALSLKIDSSSVVKAANDLDRFSASAERARGAAGNQAGSTARMAQDYGRAAEKASQFSNAASRAAEAAQRSAAAASASASSVIRLGDGYDLLTGKLNSNIVAINRNIEGWNRQGKAINDNAAQVRANTGNIAAQIQDIGVTAGMGMNPLLIALQQGTQLSAAFAGGGLKSLGAALASVISPASLLTIAIVAGTAALIQWGMEALNSADKADKLSKAIKDTQITTYALGDAQTALSNVFDLTTGKIRTQSEALRGLARAQLEVIRATAIRDKAEAARTIAEQRGRNTPAISTAPGSAGTMSLTGLGLSGRTVANETQRFLDRFSNGKITSTQAIDGMERLRKAGKLTEEQFIKLTGAVASFGMAGENLKIYEDARKALGGDRGALQQFLDLPEKRKGGGRTDADRFRDIVEGAENAIAAERMRAQAVGLSAEAAASLEQKQSMLNAANSAGIKLTDGMRAKIDELAASFGAAKVAAGTAEFLAGIQEASDLDLEKLRMATQDVGLYGRELAFATKMTDLVVAAKGRDIVVTQAMREGFVKLANDYADASSTLAKAQFGESARREADVAALSLDRERNALGLVGAAALEYAYITERLVAAKRAGIEISPAEVAAIEATGKAYAEQRYAIDEASRAIADAREITKGFFSDWLNGVREGGNVFKTFADSVINSLNRIIDKMLDRAIDDFFNNMMKSSGSGAGSGFGSFFSSISGFFGFANGGAFDRAQRFANGGAFTNTIVNTPTLFRFANGAALGEMGEAGPEAIMPLKRGPNGALGVQAHGGGLRKAEINIKQDFHMQGVMTPADVAAMVRQGSVAAVQEVKRNLDAYLREWDIDGAVST